MKAEVNGKTYCVETLIADNERLRKEIIESAKTNRLVLDSVRAEIKSKIVKRPWLDFEDRERDRNDAFLEALDIIDKYRNKVSE
jgi:hypothetical protein